MDKKLLVLYLLCDLIATLLEDHDGVRYFDGDGLHHSLDVKGTDESLTHSNEVV